MLTPKEQKLAKTGDPNIVVSGQLRWGFGERR